MKKMIAATFGLAFFTLACHNDSDHRAASIADSASVPSKQDADFMVKAASGGMLEVQLGKLAQTNGGSQAVKDFGSMMVRDHSKGGEELRSLAGARRLVIPDSISNDQRKERDNLEKKTGKNFDKAYIDLMVQDHKDDIDEFDKASKNANDPDIKAFAAKTTPMLRMHLDSAETLQQRTKRR
jgi:putative membrane protein